MESWRNVGSADSAKSAEHELVGARDPPGYVYLRYQS